MDIKVRKATTDDLNNLLPLTRAYHCVSDRKNYSEWKAEKWHRWLSLCIENDSLTCLVGTNGNDLPIGFITGVVAPAYWDNEVLICQEAGMWVVPEYRSNGIGTSLVEALAEWGRQKKCVVLAVGASQYMAPKKTSFWFRKLGFELKERSFARRL